MIVCIFLFFLCSCSTSSSHWTSYKMEGSSEEFSSERIFYEGPENAPFILELFYFQEKWNGYLHFTSIQLQEDRVTLSLKYSEKVFTEKAFVLEGKQQVLLPPSFLKALIKGLQQEPFVEITVENYQGTLYSENLSHFLEKKNLTFFDASPSCGESSSFLD